MLRLGAHESIVGGLHCALERGAAAGCDALQLWTKNSRQWRATPLDRETVTQFRRTRAAHSISPIVAHASYLINIASSDAELHRRSVRSLIEEVQRCAILEIPYLVLHPGAHTGAGMAAGLEQVVEGLEQLKGELSDSRVKVLLETTAGQGTSLGADFESLAWILEAVHADDRFGVCLDTCHAFAAGYELRTAAGYAETMSSFDQNIGLERLTMVHLNDSKHPIGSHKDRHEHIGEGHLGIQGFAHLLTDSRLDSLPGILETPKSKDLHEDRENLARLRSIVADETASEVGTSTRPSD